VLAHDGQDYSVGVFRKLKRVLDERVVAVERLDPYRSRYNAVAGRILDHNPDIVIYAGYPEQAAPLLVHLRDAGYRAPYVTTNSTDSRYFEQVVRRHDWDSPVRAFTSCGCADASKLGRADGFVKAYRAEFSEAPREYAGDIYDVMQIVVNFLKNRSATDTIDDLRRALVNRFDNVRGFSGIMKPYSWARNGELHANDRHTFMYRMRNGSWSMTGSVKKLLAN
jgi:branched-chain amino acid transport system substrate-binding protein